MSSSKFLRKDQVAEKIVIESTGKKVGKGKEIAFSLDGAAVLVVSKDDGSELEVPLTKLMGVADFIVVRSDAPQPAVRPAPKPAPRPAAVAPPPAHAPARPAAPAPQPAPAPTPAMAPAPAAIPTVCRSCGSPLKPGSKFCTKCGAAVM